MSDPAATSAFAEPGKHGAGATLDFSADELKCALDGGKDGVWAAGWIAGQLVKGGGGGLITNLIVGVIGAILGGAIFSALGVTSYGLIGSLITATVGAVLLLVVLNAIKKGK